MEQIYYYMKRDDSLHEIARIFDVPIRVLVQENQLYHNRDVFPGRRIAIPVISNYEDYPTVVIGEKNHFVKLVQQILISEDLYEGMADSKYDDKMENAVQRFRLQEGLALKAGIDDETWKCLMGKLTMKMIV